MPQPQKPDAPPAVCIRIDGGPEQIIDLSNLMLSELEVLEEHAGVDLQDMSNEASLRKVRFLGHLLWLVKLRQICAEQGIRLDKAALALPRSEFDIAAGSVEATLVTPPKSNAGPRTRTTRTPPAGSNAPRKPSATKSSAKSDASASSSTSNPGRSTG